MDLSFSTNPPLWESIGFWLAEEAEYSVGGINGTFGKETGPATRGGIKPKVHYLTIEPRTPKGCQIVRDQEVSLHRVLEGEIPKLDVY